VPIVRIRDDLGRDLLFSAAPRRIVSLVPSDTYTLFRLGCGDRVIGRTRYCDFPDVPATVPSVGGTKDVDVDAVIALRPDVVIANQEENTRAALEKLALQVPVLVSLPRRASDGISHLARIVRMLRLEKDPVAADLVRAGYAALRVIHGAREAALLTVFVPIWMEPLMTLNADTFGSDVLEVAGARNVFADRLRLYPLAADLGKAAAQQPGDRDVRYPRVRLDEVAVRAPRVILLPDEPYEFTAEDESTFAAALPGVRIVRVSGKDLFWYGAWTIEALPRLATSIEMLRRELDS